MSKEFYIGLGRTIPWHEASGVMQSTYDDVNLVPMDSEVESRSDVDLSSELGRFTLGLPVMSAPMDTITGIEMARAIGKWNGIATYPRSIEFGDTLEACEELSTDGIQCVYSVGLKKGFEESVLLKERGAQAILVDVAHGGLQSVKELANKIKEKLDVTVIAGNIATYEQALEYKKYGVDVARVGIGGGGLCTTRIKTGFGMPQFAALLETTEAGIDVIADGGIRYPGDIAKAMAIPGVKAVMVGSMFGGTDETPGEVVLENGVEKKLVRGQASREYMKDRKVSDSDHRTAEGIATTVQMIGSVEKILQDIQGGLKSAFSYAGAHNLVEYQERAVFSFSSQATQRENLPHIVFDRK